MINNSLDCSLSLFMTIIKGMGIYTQHCLQGFMQYLHYTEDYHKDGIELLIYSLVGKDETLSDLPREFQRQDIPLSFSHKYKCLITEAEGLTKDLKNEDILNLF